MFPYPSGEGLHVGHPLGYIGTDCYTRYKRMTGYNVLHPMGFDAFGLPAEQYAVETGTHPRETTYRNIERYRAQLRRLGMAYDNRRSFATTDVEYYRWTQWIFLQIFNAWYDPVARKARRISELIAEFEAGTRATPDGRPWAELSEVERRRIIDDHRLAYVAEAPVNWCPGLGTVLANEEITPEGRSERGNFPVFKRNLKQWMMRITAYADRLLEDLDRLDWTDSLKRCSATGSAGRWVPTLTSRPRRVRCGCSPPGRTPSSGPPTWCWRPSTRWWSRWCRTPGRKAPGRRGPVGTPPRGRRWPPTGRRWRT